MIKPLCTMAVLAFALAQGCVTLPTPWGESEGSKIPSRSAAEPPASGDTGARKPVRVVRPSDVTPGQVGKSIKALEDELDSVEQ